VATTPKTTEPKAGTTKPGTTKPATTTAAATSDKGVVYKVQISASGKSLELVPSNFKGLDQLSKDDSTSVIKYFYGFTQKIRDTKLNL
jgi:N-acetylmuramoyl-L-alanine amidase